MPVTDIVPTQADIDAARSLCGLPADPAAIADDRAVQTIARHRLAAERETIERCAEMLTTIEPDEDAAGCPANWSDFVQVAQSAIRATSSKDTIDA